MTEYCRFGRFSVHRKLIAEKDGFTYHENWINKDGRKYLTFNSLKDCKDVANVLSVYDQKNQTLQKENEQLKHEIEDFQTLLASKEEVYLKPVIRQIEEAYETERTQIGKNVLKQLLEAIQ